MHDFKTKMNFRGFDFDGDKLCQHNEIRKVMAAYTGKKILVFDGLESRISDLNDKEIELLIEENIKKIKIDIHNSNNSNISRGRNRV